MGRVPPAQLQKRGSLTRMLWRERQHSIGPAMVRQQADELGVDLSPEGAEWHLLHLVIGLLGAPLPADNQESAPAPSTACALHPQPQPYSSKSLAPPLFALFTPPLLTHHPSSHQPSSHQPSSRQPYSHTSPIHTPALTSGPAPPLPPLPPHPLPSCRFSSHPTQPALLNLLPMVAAGNHGRRPDSVS